MRVKLEQDGSPGLLEWAEGLSYIDLSDVPPSLRKAPADLDWSNAVIPDHHRPAAARLRAPSLG